MEHKTTRSITFLSENNVYLVSSEIAFVLLPRGIAFSLEIDQISKLVDLFCKFIMSVAISI